MPTAILPAREDLFSSNPSSPPTKGVDHDLPPPHAIDNDLPSPSSTDENPIILLPDHLAAQSSQTIDHSHMRTKPSQRKPNGIAALKTLHDQKTAFMSALQSHYIHLASLQNEEWKKRTEETSGYYGDAQKSTDRYQFWFTVLAMFTTMGPMALNIIMPHEGQTATEPFFTKIQNNIIEPIFSKFFQPENIQFGNWACRHFPNVKSIRDPSLWGLKGINQFGESAIRSFESSNNTNSNKLTSISTQQADSSRMYTNNTHEMVRTSKDDSRSISQADDKIVEHATNALLTASQASSRA